MKLLLWSLVLSVFLFIGFVVSTGSELLMICYLLLSLVLVFGWLLSKLIAR